MRVRERHPRKLLIASVGVAAVSYVACGSSNESPIANLMAPLDASTTGSTGATAGTTGPTSTTGGRPVTTGGSFFDVVANLIAPPVTTGTSGGRTSTTGAGTTGRTSTTGGPPVTTGGSFFDVVANLIAPPPPDAAPDRPITDGPTDAPSDAPRDRISPTFDVVANLIAPPPRDN